jgi:hypothetical protein
LAGWWLALGREALEAAGLSEYRGKSIAGERCAELESLLDCLQRAL